MRRVSFLAALGVVFVLATTPLATASAAIDYVVAEPPAGASDRPQSLSLGATIGPNGRYYFPLRLHYTTDINRTHELISSYFREVIDEVNRQYQDSGVNVEFVLEEIAPIGYPSSGDNEADLHTYRDTYLPDGRFGMLLVPHGGGTARGYLVGQPWETMPLRSIMPMSQFFPELVTLHAGTVAHELGHNFGLRHGGECPWEGSDDGCGYITPGGSTTIMGGVGSPVAWTYRFSDPEYLANGEPLGNANANAVRFLNEDRLAYYAPFMAPAVEPCLESADPLIRFGQTGRFEARICWRNQFDDTGVGHLAVPSPDSAVVWFFNQDNWEMLIKVLDACVEPFNRYWVFFAATTNVEFTLTVTDTEADVSKTYFNPLGQSANTVNDTNAFATCP